ncbi:hypothetical protein J6590_054497 [Homalodisca vitripennis]|nr:hypothetical protein J6590_054497 [Homalodisca vitripennis]
MMSLQRANATQRNTTRQQTINEVVNAVQKLRNPEGCTVLKICRKVQESNRHLQNFEIRDALRAAERQNLLQCKRSKYFLADLQRKSSMYLTKTNKRNVLKNSASKARNLLEVNENRSRGQSQKNLAMRTLSCHFICPRCARKYKDGQMSDVKESKASSRMKIVQDINLPSTSTAHYSMIQRGSHSIRKKNIDVDSANKNRGIVSRIFTKCRKYLLLPIIDPNCDLE